jgi:hypothetical protein
METSTNELSDVWENSRLRLAVSQAAMLIWYEIILNKLTPYGA